jgi:hypothetical protein
VAAGAEVNGMWGEAIEVPGIAALNAGDFGEVSSVSCAPASTCIAVGNGGSSLSGDVFVVSQN